MIICLTNKRAPLTRRSFVLYVTSNCLDGYLRVDGLVQGGVLVYLLVPAVRLLQRLIDVVDVLYALVLSHSSKALAPLLA